MRFVIAMFALLVAVGASAQSRESAEGATDAADAERVAQAPRRRAPLANMDDLEPAVDVGLNSAAAVPTPVPGPSTATEVPATFTAVPSAPPRAPSGIIDTLDLGTTSITGNQELPKVLYIVPWKKSDLGDLVGRPVNTLLDEVLAPVDPEVFERHLDYYETLYGDSEEE